MAFFNGKGVIVHLQIHHLMAHFGATLSIDSGRHDATGIAGTLATGKQSREAYVLQGIGKSRDADGR